MTLIVAKDGKKLGPYTAAQINAHLEARRLEPTDLGWTEGFDTWHPLNQIEGLVMPGAQESTVSESVLHSSLNPK